MAPVACTKKHHAEFVGVWIAPDTDYAEFERNKDRTGESCYKLIADYAEVPRSDVEYRTGYIFLYTQMEEEWLTGNRGVQCFLWVDDRNLTRSMKDAGKAGLPL